MKKFILLLVPLCIAAALLIHKYTAVIGVISGPELETITIGGKTYVQNLDTGFSIADKGKYLGRVSNGKETCRVYEVKGDSAGNYLYRLRGYEGAFYILEK